MYFAEVLADEPRSDEVRRCIALLHNDSPIDQQLVANLYGESRLDKPDWRELISLLLDADQQVDQAQAAIRAFCCGRTRQGGSATIPAGSILGRAVFHKRLCQDLIKLGYFNQEDSAAAGLRLLMGPLPHKCPEIWKDLLLGQFQFWSTLKPPAGRPFDGVDNEAHILCMLGLPASSSRGDGPLLLLEFQLLDTADAKIPTFCDAYAGPSWPRYFRPAPPDEPWGRTMPTDTCPEKGRPEVVHQVITGRDLVHPLWHC